MQRSLAGLAALGVLEATRDGFGVVDLTLGLDGLVNGLDGRFGDTRRGAGAQIVGGLQALFPGCLLYTSRCV